MVRGGERLYKGLGGGERLGNERKPIRFGSEK